MSELKLLPCPFCGEEAELFQAESTWVVCDKCEFESPVFESEDEDLNAASAIEWWNTRATPELPRVSAEALVEGRWYVVIDDGVKRVCRFTAGCMLYSAHPNQEGEYARFYQRADAIWGPISFELEADA